MLRGMADRFDWAKPAKAYIALYEKLLSTNIVIEEAQPIDKVPQEQTAAEAQEPEKINPSDAIKPSKETTTIKER